MMKDKLKLEGWIHIEHYDKNGNLKNIREVKNLIVNAGIQEVAKLIGAGLGGTAFQYVQTGTGTTSPTANDTDLESATGSRVSATVTNETTTVTGDTVQFVSTHSYTSSLAITEAGIFNASSGGTMLARQVFSAINVENGDTIQLTWKVVLS